MDCLPTYTVQKPGHDYDGAVVQIAGPEYPISEDLGEVADSGGMVKVHFLLMRKGREQLVRMDPAIRNYVGRVEASILVLRTQTKASSSWYQVKERNVFPPTFDWKQLYFQALTTMGSISEGLWLMNESFGSVSVSKGSTESATSPFGITGNNRSIESVTSPFDGIPPINGVDKKFGDTLADAVFQAMGKLETTSTSRTNWVERARKWFDIEETSAPAGAKAKNATQQKDTSDDPATWSFPSFFSNVLDVEGQPAFLSQTIAENDINESRKRVLAHWAVLASRGLSPRTSERGRGGPRPTSQIARKTLADVDYFACKSCDDVDVVKELERDKVDGGGGSWQSSFRRGKASLREDNFLNPTRIVAGMLNPPTKNDPKIWGKAHAKLRKLRKIRNERNGRIYFAGFSDIFHTLLLYGGVGK